MALFVAAFLAREARRRGCTVDDLAPMVDDAFELALQSFREGELRERERSQHERPTRPEPLPAGLWCDDDEATPTYDYVTRAQRRR